MAKTISAGLGTLLAIQNALASELAWCAVPPAGEQRPTGCLLELGRFPLGAGFANLSDPTQTLSEVAIKARYGDPIERRAWSSPDRQEPDTIVQHLELTYPGFAVELSGFSTAELGLGRLRVSDPKVALPCQLHADQTVHAFEKLLGAGVGPASEAPRYDWSDYVCSDDTIFAFHATITVETNADGAVSAITWEFYGD